MHWGTICITEHFSLEKYETTESQQILSPEGQKWFRLALSYANIYWARDLKHLLNHSRQIKGLAPQNMYELQSNLKSYVTSSGCSREALDCFLCSFHPCYFGNWRDFFSNTDLDRLRERLLFKVLMGLHMLRAFILVLVDLNLLYEHTQFQIVWERII